MPSGGPEAPVSRVSAVAGEAPGPGFHNGQVLSVELVKPVGDDEGLFRISGRYFRALYPSGLTPGVSVPMRVVDTGPPLVLRLPDMIAQLMAKLVHPSNTGFAAASSTLLSLADSNAFSGEAAKLAAQLKEIITLPQDPKDLAKALERLFTKNGVFHEAFLAKGEDPGDVKALAARLLALFGGDEKAGPALRALLAHVEIFQARSLIQENPVFPFFLNWGGERINGEIELVKDGEGGADGQGGGLVLRMDMPSLGHVETALWWYSGAVSVTLRVPREVEGWFAERLAPLEASLRGVSGINLSALRVVAKEPAGPATSRSLLEITV